MPEWFEAMTTPERIGFIAGVLGGLVGLASLVANTVMAKANRGMERSTAKSVEIAEQANVMTRESVQDQIETNRFSRSARVGIMDASYRNFSEADRETDFDSFVDAMVGSEKTGVMKLVLINQGAAPAYGVQVIAADHENRDTKDAWAWSPFDKESHFTSVPFVSFPVLLPTEMKDHKFAIRNSDEQGKPKPTLEVTFNVTYSDGLGRHAHSFEIAFFGTNEELAWDSPGMIIERPRQVDAAANPGMDC
jgi:hypothetical protein